MRSAYPGEVDAGWPTKDMRKCVKSSASGDRARLDFAVRADYKRAITG
jgi:hypothetical protein